MIAPIAIGDMPPTKPAHGVIATRPATAPDAAPRIVALPECSRSTTSQPSIAAAAARCVFTSACTASPSAASAEPALNPNQPNHRMPVPISVSGSECGGIGVPRPAPPPTDHQHDRQRGDARVDVHDRAAREVERAAAREPTRRREHPVRDRRVHEHDPEPDEPRPRAEPHPVGDRAGDQRGRDHREHHLVRHVQRRRDRQREPRRRGVEVRQAMRSRSCRSSCSYRRRRASTPRPPRARSRGPGRRSSA